MPRGVRGSSKFKKEVKAAEKGMREGRIDVPSKASSVSYSYSQESLESIKFSSGSFGAQSSSRESSTPNLEPTQPLDRLHSDPSETFSFFLYEHQNPEDPSKNYQVSVKRGDGQELSMFFATRKEANDWILKRQNDIEDKKREKQLEAISKEISPKPIVTHSSLVNLEPIVDQPSTDRVPGAISSSISYSGGIPLLSTRNPNDKKTCISQELVDPIQKFLGEEYVLGCSITESGGIRVVTYPSARKAVFSILANGMVITERK